MKKTIHLYASLGDLKKTAAGGGQTSARRFVRLLWKLGFNVQIVNRMVPPYEALTINEKLIKSIGFVIDPFRYFFHLLFRKRNNAITMTIGYSGKLFPYYFLFVKIGRFLGYKTAIYIKGGFTKQKYESFSNSIKLSYLKGVKSADLVLYEGEIGVNFSRIMIPETKALWIPNYVETGFAPKTLPIKPNESWNLLYFGRIHVSKNVILIVDIFDSLCSRFSNVTLTIVGSSESNYENELSIRIAQSPNQNCIKRISRIEHDKLKDILESQHFFLFPSKEYQEGHSNALNEAMSYGLVPIVSDNNFLPSIVGNDQLVVHEINADAFAKVIINIIEGRDFEKLSCEMFRRVQDNFSQSVVEKNLKEIIEYL